MEQPFLEKSTCSPATPASRSVATSKKIKLIWMEILLWYSGYIRPKTLSGIFITLSELSKKDFSSLNCLALAKFWLWGDLNPHVP